jgi:hypothetical protein
MESVARLLAANETVCFTPQNISEFWNVVTRPVAHNGLGFSVSLVAGEVEKIERILTLLRDSPGGFPGQNAQNAPPRVTRRQSPE